MSAILKKCLGAFILFAVFALIFIGDVANHGIREAVVKWISILILAFIIWLGCHLLVSD